MLVLALMQEGAQMAACTDPAVMWGDGHGEARILDAAGKVAHAGLLQVSFGNGTFGSVCGMNLEAADVACRQLGFDHGSVSPSPCAAYGASNMCGPPGSAVAMQDLRCTGDEVALANCLWSAPSDDCRGHQGDAIIHCGTVSAAAPPAQGQTRLLDRDGAPSLSGEGLLQIFLDGAWASVCGLTKGACAVACRAMGFAGAANEIGESGKNWSVLPPEVGELSCNGKEASLLDCSFQRGEAVFCAPTEAAVVKCLGDGDTMGQLVTA